MSKREKFFFTMMMIAWTVCVVFGTIAIQHAWKEGMFK